MNYFSHIIFESLAVSIMEVHHGITAYDFQFFLYSFYTMNVDIISYHISEYADSMFNIDYDFTIFIICVSISMFL